MSKNTNNKPKETKTLPTIQNKTTKATSSNATVKTPKKSSVKSDKLPEISPLKKQMSDTVNIINETVNTAEVVAPVTTETSNDLESTAVDVVGAVVIVSNELSTIAPVSLDLAVTTLETESEPINGNGKVVLIYEQYNEEFEIIDGKTTHENVDEVYCLSFVMPNCLIHLSKHKPADHRVMLAEERYDDLFVKEEPRGTYHRLEAGNTYYVYVEQEADQLARDQAHMKRIAESMEGGGGGKKTDGIVRDDGRVMESCSCIYGNPCVDEYGCKDWSNRAAIATKNGWKGF